MPTLSLPTLKWLATILALVGAVSLALLPLKLALVSLFLGCAMLAIAASDAEHFIIPDMLSLPAIPIGLLVAFAMARESGFGHDLVLLHLGAAAVGAIALYSVREFYRWSRGREGLGMGDVKLAAAGGAWTGYEGLGHVLLLACLLAFAYVLASHARDFRALRGSMAIPFGVFLAPSIWLVWCATAATAPGGNWDLLLP